MTGDAALSQAAEAFFRRGWVAFDPDPGIRPWTEAAWPVAERRLADAIRDGGTLRCGGSWFAGVNVFPNDASGAAPGEGVPPLSGRAIDFVERVLGFPGIAFDRAQVSICLPGYPAWPDRGESEAAFRYRRDRDAAHLDGLLRDESRRRRIGEVHGFILGIPLNAVPAQASPMVVWEGSHEVMREAFRARLAGIATSDWPDADVTEAYVEARRRVFAECPRVPVRTAPGGSYLVHRLAIHGVAPWGDGGGSVPRAVAYFRPDPFPGAAPDWWLARP